MEGTGVQEGKSRRRRSRRDELLQQLDGLAVHNSMQGCLPLKEALEKLFSLERSFARSSLTTQSSFNSFKYSCSTEPGSAEFHSNSWLTLTVFCSRFGRGQSVKMRVRDALTEVWATLRFDVVLPKARQHSENLLLAASALSWAVCQAQLS